MERTRAGSGRKGEGEEGAAERCCYGLTSTPLPHPPALLRVGGGRRVGSEEGKLNLGKKGLVEGAVFRFVFVSHHPNVFHLVIN